MWLSNTADSINYGSLIVDHNSVEDSHLITVSLLYFSLFFDKTHELFRSLDALSQNPLPFPLRAPSFSPQSVRLIPERTRRVCDCGSSGGLSASLLLLIAGCCRETLARTALSRIKQVVRLSHNFIVHFSPTAEHGASRNQQVSPGKRGEQHRGRAMPDLQLLTMRTKTSQNTSAPSGLFFKPLEQMSLEESPAFKALFPGCAHSLRPCSPSVLKALSERRGPARILGARVTSGGPSSDCSCLHPSRKHRDGLQIRIEPEVW